MWRRLDTPGHDVCRLIDRPLGWAIEGYATFLHRADDASRTTPAVPCALSYSVTCDRDFVTLAARVRGWIGRKPFTFEITRDRRSNWRLNGTTANAVKGCVDVDINISPSTNLLSLRRLRPRRGQLLTVKAAWLAFPEASLAPLEQTYERSGANTYEYHAPSLDFSSRLVVNRHGLVLEYPPLWTQEIGK